MAETTHRLHPVSWLFIAGNALKRVGLPMLAFLFMGKRQDQWALWAALPIGVLSAWSIARALSFHYSFGARELLVRDGIFDRSEKHIPYARIQNVSQRRKLFHRLLGVTELHLESAAGGKPEAVMKVLGVAQAAELEALLRGAGTAEAHAVDTPAAPVNATTELLRLPLHEIIRLGIASNRGMFVVLALFGAISQRGFSREQFGAWFKDPLIWASRLVRGELAAGHAGLVVLEILLVLLLLFLLLRVLSVVLAFIRYYDFKLEREGDKLTVSHGFGTHVRSGVRLARLQRWDLQQGWWHRRLGRCRLAVSVVANGDEQAHGMEASAQFKELAPIASWAQAQALLRLCQPTLDWDALVWHSVDGAAMRRRLLGQARWVLPTLLGLILYLGVPRTPLAVSAWLVGVLLLGGGLCLHARAWARFAAYAETGDLLLHRSGVFSRHWIVIDTPRLQTLRVYSSALDRRLGLVHLQGDTQGGSGRRRALDISCLAAAQAEALRARLWPRLQAGGHWTPS